MQGNKRKTPTWGIAGFNRVFKQWYKNCFWWHFGWSHPHKNQFESTLLATLQDATSDFEGRFFGPFVFEFRLPAPPRNCSDQKTYHGMLSAKTSKKVFCAMQSVSNRLICIRLVFWNPLNPKTFQAKTHTRNHSRSSQVLLGDVGKR